MRRGAQRRAFDSAVQDKAAEYRKRGYSDGDARSMAVKDVMDRDPNLYAAMLREANADRPGAADAVESLIKRNND